jgi:hypothetical protein
MRGFVGIGNGALLGLLICIVPMVFGAWFAVRPGERLLSLMRPLTLMGIFSAMYSFALALANAARTVGMMKAMDLDGIHRVGLVLSEGLSSVVASFGCLTVAWALVVIGMRRTTTGPNL